MSNNTDFKEGKHNDFIQYLFSNEPQSANSIQLELPIEDSNKNINLHIFEQLLMIYVDGLKFFYGVNGTVSLNTLSHEQISKVNQYFISFGYQVNIDTFETINDYQFKFPDYFKNKEHIKNNTQFSDFFYEIFDQNNKAYRISFSRLS